MKMGIESEYHEKMVRQKPSKLRPFLPAIGFVLIALFALIAFVLSGPLATFLEERLKITVPRDQESTLQLAVAGGVFLVLLMILAIFYSLLFAKKPEKAVSEKELEQEKAYRLREKEAAKLRKKKAAAEMRRRNAERNRLKE
jgi:nitrate/nitrite transporter NarK